MKRLNVTHERILNLIRKINTDSKTETYKAERELCELLSAVINAMWQIENYTERYIRDYPYDCKIYDVQNLSFYGKIGKLPKEIQCNIDEHDGFVFFTEWLNINLDKYFNKLRNDAIRYKRKTFNNLKTQYISQCKTINANITRLNRCKISDLEFQIK